jgi:CBS domain containing-hemolysin-like protein
MLSAVESTWYLDVLGLLSVPALVALNGLFVAAEFALVAVRKTRVEEMVAQGVPRARAVHAAVENLDRNIAATQLGITLASIALGWVGEPALAHLVQPLFEALPGPWAFVAVHSTAVAFAFFLITFMHVVFGELIPKTMALQRPDQTALWVVPPLALFARVTRPFIVTMNGTGNLILRLCGYKPARGEQMVHSVEELQLLIEDTEQAGIIDPVQAEFVQNVFELADKEVQDSMVPREEMAALELHTPADKVLDAVRSGAHTRMPVYEGTLDQIVGIVNTKDLFYLFSLKGIVVLEDALYPPLYLKPNESVANALRLFRKTHRPMALVRDDDGRILGLLTLEDVVEEIVGDIEDEHDRPTPKLAPTRKPMAGQRVTDCDLKPVKPDARTNRLQ